MSSHHDTTLSALGSTTPTGTDLNDKGIGSGTDTNTNTNTNPNPTTQNTTADQQTTHGHSNMGGPSHGSSTGAAGAAPGLSSSTQYDPHSTGYNPSTGSGYQTGSHAESKKTPGEGLGAGMGKTGESVGQGARDIYKGIHGAGESLRGALNGAVDQAFGSTKGVEKNQSIVQKGEKEMSGR